ncbi:MAG: hypothetical protein IJQ67_04230 [Bacilli bacterium]|nr:hypothetical protein [Bacilli bacterium]
MKKIIGVGACVLDTLIEMDEYPKEDIKIRANNIFSSGGGPVSNALVCISKLGLESEYLGLLSKDSSGERLINEFDQYGVKTRNIRMVENTTAFVSYIVLAKKSGTRTCVAHAGNVPDDPSLLDFSMIKDYDILHLDGNYLNIALEAIKEAKKHGVLVSLDAGSVYPNIEIIMPYIDILIPSEEFALKFTKQSNVSDAIKKLNHMYHPKVLVVTQGSKGGMYLEGDKEYHYDAFKIECVDSNGAGDTFHGAFLVAYLEGKSIKECVRFASATSAIKCQKAGARIALPNKDEVISFLNERS